MPDASQVESDVRDWLERVVIGLNLCPFAATPYRNGQMRITISQAATERELLNDLQAELERLAATPLESLETTLLVAANILSDFDAYNQFLDDVDFHLRRGGWDDEFQVASFHPQYQFEGTESDDPGNLTNRSPWPILHILRESSIDAALASYPNPEQIPTRNIETMQRLSDDERRELFPYA